MIKFLASMIFCLLGTITLAQCLTLDGSKKLNVFFENIELKKAPPKIERIVREIGFKFFPGRKDTVKVVGYVNENDEHPSAYATSSNLSMDFKMSQEVAGPSKVGFIWLDYQWMTNTWKKRNYELQPEVVFLLGHEVAHIVHKKDTQWQRKIELNSEGKPLFDKKGNPVFKKDENGDFIGFFDYITDDLADHAKEIHADYAGGIIIYDLMLFKHESWLKSKDKAIQKAHKMRIDKIVKCVVNMIRKELAFDCTSSHGSADDRVKQFLKGIEDRRAYLNQLENPNFRLKIVKLSTGMTELLQRSGHKIRDYVSSDKYRVCPR